MQSSVEDPARAKMAELRLICDREIPIKQQNMDSAIVAFRNSLESIKSTAQGAAQNQVKLGKLKANLRELETDLVKALAVKNRKEAKRMALLDSISSAKARNEELKSIVQDQRARKDEYAAILSQQCDDLAMSNEKSKQDVEHRGAIQQAIAWYNRVLGFQIEGGCGVKFIFTNINLKNPTEEYYFTIRHENDTYTLLDCNPHLNDTKELIHELNKTNGLFEFVRIMRAKFQEAAASGFLPQISSNDRGDSMICTSAPVSSISTDSRGSSPAKQNELQIQDGVAA
ncbi:kinetochore protein SPC25 homolog [Malania oleifera]|uniref:kinetochore protein SPC25 homolog n=1 Tax=Malania oleifera TaxID=397392 RepID=UPI0025ADFEFB|nr:kinetochore protein SPC25 homolog [Malania oleifera]